MPDVYIIGGDQNFCTILRECKNQDYTLNLIYFWLQTPELALERVRKRVASGGHNIPEEVIRRRYERGRKNLTQLYLPLCDTWIIYNNSASSSRLVAASGLNQPPVIYDYEAFRQITASSNS